MRRLERAVGWDSGVIFSWASGDGGIRASDGWKIEELEWIAMGVGQGRFAVEVGIVVGNNLAKIRFSA